MTDSLEKLLSALRTPAYTALTQEEMEKQAARRYQSVYDQKRLSAKQTYEAGDQALARQLETIQSAYEVQRAQSDAAYRKAYAQAGRQALTRGMQRSSYTGATLAGISRAGAQARHSITGEQTAKEQDIASQRTLAAQQLSAQLAQYDAAQKNDELAYLDQLEQREYDRAFQSQAAANNLAFSLYNARTEQEQQEYQRRQDELNQQNWLREFEYRQQQDMLSQQNWLKEFEYQQQQDALSQQNWLKEYNAKYGSSAKNASGSSSRKRTEARGSNVPLVLDKSVTL